MKTWLVLLVPALAGSAIAEAVLRQGAASKAQREIGLNDMRHLTHVAAAGR